MPTHWSLFLMPLTTVQILALVIALAAVLVPTASQMPGLQLAAAGVVALAITAAAISDNLKLRAAGAPKPARAVSTAQYLGWVWAWGALAILIAYAILDVGDWKEWWQFVAGFGLAAIASLGFARLLQGDVAAGKSDEGLLKAGRIATIAQVVGVVAALVTMFIEGKFPRDIAFADWAGINIFMFGGLAILLISLNALREPKAA
jgi:hypothetical protein